MQFPVVEPDTENADVDFDYPSPGEYFNVTWDPEDILPPRVIDDPLSFTVDIILYEFNLDTGLWVELQVLATNVPNTGERQVTIQAIEDNSRELPDVCPIAIAVAVSGESTSLSSNSKRDNDWLARIKHAAGTAKQWTKQTYAIVIEKGTEAIEIVSELIETVVEKGAEVIVIVVEGVTSTVKRSIRQRCNSWCGGQLPNIGQEILRRLPPCPPTTQKARRDPQFEIDEHKSLISFFHPGADSCFRQRIIRRLAWMDCHQTIVHTSIDLYYFPCCVHREHQGSGQQCCYDHAGLLIIGPDSGGTVDLYSPKSNFLGHQLHDVLPYLYCCVGSFPDCNAYYQKRPSSDGTGYQCRPPGMLLALSESKKMSNFLFFLMQHVSMETLTLLQRTDLNTPSMERESSPSLRLLATVLPSKEEWLR